MWEIWTQPAFRDWFAFVLPVRRSEHQIDGSKFEILFRFGMIERSIYAIFTCTLIPFERFCEQRTEMTSLEEANPI
jgi:hypothetical protein